MIWAEIAPVLLSTVQSLALRQTDPLWKAEWIDSKRTFGSPKSKVKIFLEVTSSREELTEERSVFVPGSPGSITRTQHGSREFTLNIQAKSYSQEYVDWAHEYAERIRTRIQRKTVLATLRAANVALVRVGEIRDMSYDEDGIALSVANLDVIMRAAFADDPQTGLGWIETIELTSHVQNPAGVEYPAPPNGTVVIP